MAQAESARGWERSVRTLDLLLWLWRLLASAQFAVALIGFLAFVGLLSVLLPQVPEAIRDNPSAVDAWLESERGDFGVFTDALYRVGLFTVIDAWWFLTGLGLLAVSVVVYTLDRSLATWRNVTRPQERLPDSFFDRAANRIVFAPPAEGAARLADVLRRRRFRVHAFASEGATYLFADRFAWAQLGGFASHAAVVVLLAGGLVSHFGGFTQDLLIAEGTTSPVFAVSHPEQMLVQLDDTIARFDAEGSPTDYRSELVIYQGGREVARGTATVNDPFSYNGYRFHQAGYLGDGAALRVRDVSTGNTAYTESLLLEDPAPAPSVRVTDAQGAVLLDDVIVPTDFVERAQGTVLTLPGAGRTYWVGIGAVAEDVWQMIVYDPSDESTRFVLAEGASETTADGLTWTFEQAAGVPSTVTEAIPGDGSQQLVMMSRTPEGTPYLTLLGPVDGRALTLYPNEPVRAGDREYVFEGRREFAGIEVRKDPGANFIWAGAGLLILGLLVTFYVPRLRLWGRVRGDEAVVASLAERSGIFHDEARRLVKELGVEAKREGEANA
jgi:cytochrome c biogenesis protein ResB